MLTSRISVLSYTMYDIRKNKVTKNNCKADKTDVFEMFDSYNAMASVLKGHISATCSGISNNSIIVRRIIVSNNSIIR